jgi:hypothetical protein
VQVAEQLVQVQVQVQEQEQELAPVQVLQLEPA